MHARKIMTSVAFALVFLATSGWLVAKASLDACERAMTNEISIHRARAFAGPSPPGYPSEVPEVEVVSRVLYPFVASVEFSVPLGFHASYHKRLFLTLGFRNIMISASDIYLAFQGRQRVELIANNSFKPSPLRGLV